MVTTRLLVLTTGGTIAGQVASSDRIPGDARPSQAVGALRTELKSTLAQIEEVWGVTVEIDTAQVVEVDSSDILPSDWVSVTKKIEDNYDRYNGFVVTHGTNTMGYTSAALSFALTNVGKPVVVTGSQVPFGWPGSDALMNLQNAVRVAAWPYEGGVRGVVCVFGSHIIGGTRAKKNTEFDYDAFQSFSAASLGRIGRIIDVNLSNLDRHHRYLSREKPAALRAVNLDVKKDFNPHLLSFTEFPGMDAGMFMDLLKVSVERRGDERLRGVVFRAFGAGDVSTHLHDCFRYLKDQEVPIVVTTQAPNGNSNFKVNEPGLLLDKHDLAIPAYDMSIESITTKLMWLIGQSLGYSEIKTRMVTDLHGEITVYVERR